MKVNNEIARCPYCYHDLKELEPSELRSYFCSFCYLYFDEDEIILKDTSFFDEIELEIEDVHDDPYALLKQELDSALKQASGGKGKERHAKEGQNFEDQVMCEVQRLLMDHPCGGLAYQVIKKTIESGRLLNEKGVDSAKKEVYGAINYLGGMNIIYEEQK